MAGKEGEEQVGWPPLAGLAGDAWGEGQERVPGLPITPTCLQVVGNKVDAEGAKVIGQMDSPGLTKVKVLIS